MLRRCLLQAVKKATKPFKMLLTARNTWEKRSFHRLRHIETSDELTVVLVAEAIRKTLLKDRHIPLSKPDIRTKTNATEFANARTNRIGAYNNFATIQYIGYRTEIAMFQIELMMNHVGSRMMLTRSSTTFAQDSNKIQTTENKRFAALLNILHNGAKNSKNSISGFVKGRRRNEKNDRALRVTTQNHLKAF